MVVKRGLRIPVDHPTSNKKYFKFFSWIAIELFFWGLGWIWAFRVAYPVDLRRIWLAVLTGVYLVWPRAKKRLSLARLLRALLALMMNRRQVRAGLFWGVILFWVGSGALRALALQYTLFDVGIYHQLLWNLSHGNGFLSPLASEQGLFLKDHWVISLISLAPFYWLTFGNSWLLGILPGVLAGGALASTFGAWIFLASRFPHQSQRRRAWVSSIIILGSCGFQAFWGNLSWGFHENLVGAAFLSWALALYFTAPSAYFPWVMTLLGLAAGVKETYLLVVAFTALGLLLFEKSKWKKILFMLLGMICLGIFFWYSQSDRDPSKNYFSRYFGYLGNDLTSVARTLLLSPIQVLKNWSVKEIFNYFLAILMPLGLIPFIIALSTWSPWAKLKQSKIRPQIRRLPAHDEMKNATNYLGLGLIPSIGLALLASYPSLRDPGMHYFFEVVPILGVMMVLSFYQMRSKTILKWSFLWLVFSWSSLESQPLGDLRFYARSIAAQAPLLAQLSSIPNSQSVMAEDPLGAWISGRASVAVWSRLSTLKGRCPDYYVFKAKTSDSLEGGHELSQELRNKIQDMQTMRGACSDPRPFQKQVIHVGDAWIYAPQGMMGSI